MMSPPPMPPTVSNSSIDWEAVGGIIASLLTGAGVAIGALWKKIKAQSQPQAQSQVQSPTTVVASPFTNGSLLPAAISALRESTVSVAEAENAVRSVQDTALDTQRALGSQISALREVTERLEENERKSRRIVKDLEKKLEEAYHK